MDPREWHGADLEAEKPTPAEVEALYDKLAEVLRDKHPALQGAVLAKAVAAWAAGHQVAREQMLEDWLRLMRKLLPDAIKRVDAWLRRRGHA